jgi:hypothetical protein
LGDIIDDAEKHETDGAVRVKLVILADFFPALHRKRLHRTQGILIDAPDFLQLLISIIKPSRPESRPFNIQVLDVFAGVFT